MPDRAIFIISTGNSSTPTRVARATGSGRRLNTLILMGGNMQTASPTGNELLRLISQRIDKRRKQEQCEELPAPQELLEFASQSEIASAELYEQPDIALDSRPDVSKTALYGQSGIAIEPQTGASAADVDDQPFAAFESPANPATEEHLDHSVSAFEYEFETATLEPFESYVSALGINVKTAVAELCEQSVIDDELQTATETAAMFEQPITAFASNQETETADVIELRASALDSQGEIGTPEAYERPITESEFFVESTTPVLIERSCNAVEFQAKELAAELFVEPGITRESEPETASTELFERPGTTIDSPAVISKGESREQPIIDVEFAVDDYSVDDLNVPLKMHEIQSERQSSEDLKSYALPPPDYAEFHSQQRTDPPPGVVPDEAVFVPDEEGENDRDEAAAAEVPMPAIRDFHVEIGTDERHFLLWQYVGGDMRGADRDALHAHILVCKDCASYIWKLTTDSISKPITFEDPMPRASVPLPSLDEPDTLDDWIKPDSEVDRSAYVWNLAASATEPTFMPMPALEPITTDKAGKYRSLSSRRKGLIAAAFAVTAIVCFAAVPALRGKPEASELRAQLKKLEEKSDQLKKEVEEGRAVRDQLLQVQRETELVRKRYENAQGAFQKMSSEVADPASSATGNATQPYPITLAAPPPDTRETDAVLNDGNGQVTMDTNGDIVGLPNLAADLRQSVRAVIRDHHVEVPSISGKLASDAGTITTSNGAARDGVMLVSPVATMVEWTKPTLNWMPVGGAVSYKVQVRNAAGQMVTQGEASAGTEWTVPDALASGNTYSWTVVPLQANGTPLFPSLHTPTARFGVLSKVQQDEIQRIRTRYSDSNLVVGLASLKYQLYDNAAREFKTLLESNTNSALAKKLADAPSRRFGEQSGGHGSSGRSKSR